MTDWLDELSPEEQQEWNDIVAYARTETFEAMNKATFVISLAPHDQPDVKFCVELGMTIMMNKPVIVVAAPGLQVPEGLRRVAYDVIELNADPDTAEGQAEMMEGISRVVKRLGLSNG